MDTSMASTLSRERTVARREDGGKAGSQDLQERRSETFMTPMPGDEAPPAGKDSPAEGDEIPKCKLAFEEVEPARCAAAQKRLRAPPCIRARVLRPMPSCLPRACPSRRAFRRLARRRASCALGAG